jgi:chromosome segregation ATPase
MCINSNVCHNGYRGSNCKYYHGPICNENPNVCECINVHYCIDGIKCENKKTCGNIHEPDSKYLESIFQSKDNTKHSVLKILCKLQEELRSTQEELKNSKRELETLREELVQTQLALEYQEMLNDNLNKAIDTREKQIEVANLKISDLDETIGSLNRELEEFRANTRISKYEREIEFLRCQIEAINRANYQSMASYEIKIEEIKGLNETNVGIIKTLETQIIEYKSQIYQHQEQYKIHLYQQHQQILQQQQLQQLQQLNEKMQIKQLDYDKLAQYSNKLYIDFTNLNERYSLLREEYIKLKA